MPTAVAVVGFLPPFVCMSVYPHDISKPMQLGSQKFKFNTQMFHHESGNPCIWGAKGQRSRSRVTKTALAWVFALL